MASKKLKPTDGLGPLEIKKLRSALRLVWHRSHARRLVVKRCTDAQGFTFCEECLSVTPKLKIDHITACGEMDGGYIARLFCPSSALQGMCDGCHKLKTRAERAALKGKKSC